MSKMSRRNLIKELNRLHSIKPEKHPSSLRFCSYRVEPPTSEPWARPINHLVEQDFTYLETEIGESRAVDEVAFVINFDGYHSYHYVNKNQLRNMSSEQIKDLLFSLSANFLKQYQEAERKKQPLPNH